MGGPGKTRRPAGNRQNRSLASRGSVRKKKERGHLKSFLERAGREAGKRYWEGNQVLWNEGYPAPKEWFRKRRERVVLKSRR